MPDGAGSFLQPGIQAAIQDVKDGKLPELDPNDARQIIDASRTFDGDHFGIPDDVWKRLERVAEGPQPPQVSPTLPQPPGTPAPEPSGASPPLPDWASAKIEKDLADAQTRYLMNRIMSERANEQLHQRQANPQPPPPDPERQERDKVLEALFGSAPPGAAGNPSASEPEIGVELLATHTITDPVASPTTLQGNGSRVVLIAGGIVAVLLIIGGGVVASQMFGQTSSTPPSTAAAGAHSPAASAGVVSSLVSASIGGIGENSTKDPALVVCQIRGTVTGMEFHGTLSGDNIGSTAFDVKTGQSSQGVSPASPDDAVFAVAFPGTGGQHGGGPLGPFYCTLTSVDVPSGYQLAPHQPAEWTMKVS
ncbi:MAG: hypothetical protein ACHQ0J_13715 [Candidatus Dormibacterales bacterium]